MSVCVCKFAPAYLRTFARVLPFVSQLCVSVYKCATMNPRALVWFSAGACLYAHQTCLWTL